MKKLLIGLLALGSFSVLAQNCPSGDYAFQKLEEKRLNYYSSLSDESNRTVALAMEGISSLVEKDFITCQVYKINVNAVDTILEKLANN